ncbi:glycosyltransferase [Psychrobacter sp. KCTC 72983]|uniref:glycosyltransferase n=1 Tax=Psychrobacter sp. KCTC 72983 TaxID=2733866 RepID=UPI00164558A1|nr:glycosyltransferase [Psychrobacter sp. KCTC 72983]
MIDNTTEKKDNSNSKEKVLLVINCLQGGGAERSVLTLGQGFHELGYDVHILRFKSKVAYELNDDITYHQLDLNDYNSIPTKSLRYWYFAKVLDRYVLKEIGIPILTLANLDKADMVLRHSSLPNIAHVIRNTISKKIELFRSQGKKANDKRLSNIYSRHPCICISKGVEKDFQATLGVMNTTTIYNPIDQRQIVQLASEFEPEFDSYIIHVGSFKTQKAHEVLIRSYAKTRKTLPLLLLGEGVLLASMKELVTSLGLDNRVHFLGFQKNPYPYIQKAQFMVLSSVFEGFGRVIAESLALGTPVISTDCPSGPSELLPPHNLVPVGDIDTLAKKMDEAMEKADRYQSSFDKELSPINIAQQYIDFMRTNG